MPADALGLAVEADHLDPHVLADMQHVAQVVDALPRDVGDVQEAVEAAQVDERTVVGDVLDHALEDLALLQGGQELVALLRPALLEHGAPADHDVAAAASILRIRNGSGLLISGPMSRTGRMSTWLPGRNATHRRGRPRSRP